MSLSPSLSPAILACLLSVALAPAQAAAQPSKYVIQKGDTPAEVARKLGVPLDELMRFNNLSPNGPFKVGQELEVPHSGEVTGATYVVKAGDSVAKVADFHGVSQDDLRAANGMKPDDVLKPGQEIVIPMDLRGGAERSHVIRKGDTFASIAKKYEVTPRALARANKLGKGSPLKVGRILVIPDPEEEDDLGPPRKTDTLVRSGEKVPQGVMHTVQPGQSLWTIARAYAVPGEKILKANSLMSPKAVSVGQKILVPGASDVVPVRVRGFSVQPVHFVRVRNGQEITVRLVNKAGNVNPASRKALSRLSGPTKKGKGLKLLHPRLIHMIERVAERYPGQTLEIISGYRPLKRGHAMNQHAKARALDFRVRGVANRELYDFIKNLPDSGAGFYPNSVFVHMDARDRAATWTDWSGVGEKAQYRKPKDKADEAADAVEAEADSKESSEE
jgi:LysM repeat protein